MGTGCVHSANGRYGCPLLFIVGVDDENRSCVLGQGVLRSECTETFEWFLNQYETADGARRPKVILTDADLAMTSTVRNCWKTTFTHVLLVARFQERCEELCWGFRRCCRARRD
ncbi:unnamed protein product, partial [Ectocarpus sp. 6 AP-2014]